MLIYTVIPNTHVKFSSGLTAGIITGISFSILQWIYIEFQVGVSRLNSIYGSFAALPLFIIWLQLTWTIILGGAALAFANQNVDMYEAESDALKISQASRRSVAIMIMRKIAQRFAAGEELPTSTVLAKELHLPIRLVRSVIHDMVSAGLLIEMESKEHKTNIYLPARDINTLTLGFVCQKLDRLGNDKAILNPASEYDKYLDINKLLKENPGASDMQIHKI